MEEEHQPPQSEVSASALLPEVYDDLRKLARGIVARDRLQTLTATALVHEAWLKMSKDDNSKWESRRHFFGAAAEFADNLESWLHGEPVRSQQEIVSTAASSPAIRGRTRTSVTS